MRNEFSFDKILNDDIIFVMEDMLYPDNSYLIYLKNKLLMPSLNLKMKVQKEWIFKLAKNQQFKN